MVIELSRRRNDDKLFLIVLVGGGLFALVNFVRQHLWIFLIISGCVLLFLGVGLYFYLKRINDKKMAYLRSGIEDIDKMDGEEFEKFLEAVFIKMGYIVERTPYSKDYGADLIVYKNKNKTAIQAKRYSNNVGVLAIQEITAARGHYRCQKGMVITNSYFTKQARELARTNGIILWDREALIKEIANIKKIRIEAS